ncbi:MAG: hypothetical protein Q4B70_00885 [Lachnospiraceae bacterium]|nr:hypothetical protein [Lachnospiraceae bacterium]
MKKGYSEIDYESEYNKQVEKLEEYELKNLLKKKEAPYLYKTKTITSGKLTEVEIFPVFKYKRDRPRNKEKKTKQSQWNLNDKNARKKFIRYLCTNFANKDYWCTFNYAEPPESIEEAEKNMKNYIRRLNYRRKKDGLPSARYMYITEIGSKGRVHHHLVIDGLVDRDTIEDLWTLGKRNHVRRLEEDDFGLTGLAAYLSKDPKGRKRWKGSKNLKKPKETENYSRFRKNRVRKMARNQNSIETELKKEAPYKNLKFLDADVRWNGVNGLFYIYARMVRKE